MLVCAHTQNGFWWHFWESMRVSHSFEHTDIGNITDLLVFFFTQTQWARYKQRERESVKKKKPPHNFPFKLCDNLLKLRFQWAICYINKLSSSKRVVIYWMKVRDTAPADLVTEWRNVHAHLITLFLFLFFC